MSPTIGRVRRGPLLAVLALLLAASTGTGVGAVTGAGAGAMAPGSDARLVTAVAPPPPAVPRPFGKLTCGPAFGIRLCRASPAPGQDPRVASFDGVPLDADLALPAHGSGPFPLIVLLHGLGGSKADFETTRNDGGIDDVTLADQGYAVLMYTARGFGSSCGTPASRAGTPACGHGWVQLADQRYEIRDTQYLAGELVDEGIVKPGIAVSGVSYGAGQSLELAVLKNRTRLADGALVPFTSPVRHVPMRVTAVYAMWPWDDLVTSLVPNGHLSTVGNTPSADDLAPAGVAKESWNTLLYGVAAANFLAPPGADPQADLTTWYHELLAGEPYTSSEAKALRILQSDKSAIGIPLPAGGPAATAIQSGWTDSLFPVSEAEHYANRVAAVGDHTPMLLMFDDVGHGWAQNKSADIATTNSQAIAFLNALMKPRASSPPRTGVLAIPQTCPASAPSGPAATAPTLGALARRTVRLTAGSPQVVSSSGGDPAVAADLDPAYAGRPLCDALPAATEAGTAHYLQGVGPKGFTLIGGARVTARLRVVGRYPELVARLWDVAPGGATRQIVAMGVYRPSVDQGADTAPGAVATESATFELNPNEYTFAPGHAVELELVGSNAPYFRPSNGTYTITVSSLRAALPVR